MIFLKRWNRILVALSLAAAIPTASLAQTFQTLVIFDGSNGAGPVDTPLVQGTDGNFYGTTLGGGSNGSGTVFKITGAGKLTTLYSFCSQANCSDGSGPYGGLVLASSGNFYGTTSSGGASGIYGTVFRITPGGSLTTLHSFDGTDGAGPIAPMIRATDGNFYGITQYGGVNAGTVFKMTPNGALTTLHSFGSDGYYPTGPLVEGIDRNLYGTTELGGASGTSGRGTVFRITRSGDFSTLHSFDSTDGSSPACGLVQAADGNLYGTTYQGGSNNSCPNGCGTVFKISLGGALTTLYSFDSIHGANPIAGLIQANDGNFYGTTYAGGTGGDWGTVFRITPSGTITTLHSFQGTDGAQPIVP